MSKTARLQFFLNRSKLEVKVFSGVNRFQVVPSSHSTGLVVPGTCTLILVVPKEESCRKEYKYEI